MKVRATNLPVTAATAMGRMELMSPVISTSRAMTKSTMEPLPLIKAAAPTTAKLPGSGKPQVWGSERTPRACNICLALNSFVNNFLGGPEVYGFGS